MRYNKDTEVIEMSVREFVSDARRCVCTSLPFDDCEPHFPTPAARLRATLLQGAEPRELEYGFKSGEYLFSVKGGAHIGKNGELLFVFISENPHRPRKEERAEARGEAFVAAYLHLMREGGKVAEIKIVFASHTSGDVNEVGEVVDIETLEKFFTKCAAAVKKYARPEIERVTERIPSMKTLEFPYESKRAGQGEFIRKVYKNIARGGTLVATAPTGTGKTVSALFPAVRAIGDGRRDKIFYLTPKDTTAYAAKECIELFCERGAKIRAVMIGAKEKRCENGLLCRESRSKCENAKLNNLPDAVLALYDTEAPVADSEVIARVAREYKVCPHELSLAYSELCDVIICDFNYLFDPRVYIRRFFSEGGNYAFLVDEAHNLPDRAREMYSAAISVSELSSPADEVLIAEHSPLKNAARVGALSLYDTLFGYVKEEIREDDEGKKCAGAHTKELPVALYEIIDGVIAAAEDELHGAFSMRDREREERIKFVRNYLAGAKRFREVMECFDSCYEAFIFYEEDNITIKLYCIDTGTEIAKRLSKGGATVFFSATLTPLYYYKSMFGDRAAEELMLDSPFDPSQLSVTVMDKISTRYSEREDTLIAAVRAIAAAIGAKRGNYMIFSPSFAYSQALARVFTSKYPKIRTLVQKKNMTKREKEEFLEEFTKDDSSYLVAFCVMGGIYSEGIDLAGEALIGAVIIGIGMPALSYEREAICAYYDDKYEEGKQFAYIYPGMNRVLQAAGRVIRREDDRGIIVLIDDRFDDPIYKKIIPSLWSEMKFIADAKSLREEIDLFWKSPDKK